MNIEHVALWTCHLEEMKDFYCEYFQGRAGDKYVNPAKGFESYFLTFASGARVELMRKIRLSERSQAQDIPCIGLAHFAFSAGSKAAVDTLTDCLQNVGCRVISEPRLTGDGYYESCILDPDGNEVEITE